MRAQQLLRSAIRAIDTYKAASQRGSLIPEPHQIWLTRDGAHRVLILLKDQLRPDSQYPITGLVLDPETDNRFTRDNRIQYPRYTRDGKFIYGGQESPLDLVQLVG